MEDHKYDQWMPRHEVLLDDSQDEVQLCSKNWLKMQLLKNCATQGILWNSLRTSNGKFTNMGMLQRRSQF